MQQHGLRFKHLLRFQTQGADPFLRKVHLRSRLILLRVEKQRDDSVDVKVHLRLGCRSTLSIDQIHTSGGEKREFRRSQRSPERGNTM